MFGMMTVFAEFERSMIQERVRAGLARARANGIRLGWPGLDSEKAVMIRDHLAQGLTFGRVAELVGCGTSTVQHIRPQMAYGKLSIHSIHTTHGKQPSNHTNAGSSRMRAHYENNDDWTHQPKVR
jgi:DNA invertase Pin-like site-specific DNA recombinase